MRILTTVSAFLLLISSISCTKKTDFLVGKNNQPLEGVQVVPAVASSSSGIITYSYNKTTRVLSFVGSWSVLSGAPAAIHLHGPAAKGAPGGIIQTLSGFSTATTGVFNFTAFVDGAVIKEADLLNGQYYFDIHTASYAVGELRGQLTFQ
jgi:hypothetical protein